MAFAGLLQRKVGRAAAFRASAAKTLHGYPAALASLLDIYSLSEVATTSATDDDVLMRLLTLMSDLIFFLPAVELAAKFPNDSFVAAFNEPNPWEGLFKGHASHILDVAFLFQNFNDSLDQTQTASAVAFGTDVIAFVNGAEPWKTFNGSGKGAGVYADGKRRYSDKEMTNRHDLLQLAHDSEGPGLDRLVLVATGFMDG
jgi:carboxylesterase type B